MDVYVEDININLTKRKKHGALLDAELLADVFLEMNGGRQQGIDLEIEKKNEPKSFLMKINRCIQKK